MSSAPVAMAAPSFSAVAWVLLLAAPFYGCLDGPANPALAESGAGSLPTTFRVLDASSAEPVFLARVTVLNASGPVVVVATDRNGTAPVLIPDGADAYEVAATGFAADQGRLGARASVIVVRLTPLANATDVFAGSGLRFRAPVDLGTRAYPFAVGTSCQDALDDRDGDCGLGEPSVEVDAKGTIYVTGTCCIGSAPPIFVSRDDGETFQELSTPTRVRESFGIEADLAIDGTGAIYMADIELAATFQLTAWGPDGTFLRHTKWPAPPLVDRDWIRAEGDGKLYYVYNTGSATNVYTSGDGGMTWSPRPVFSAPYGLGNAVKGTQDGELWILSPGGQRRRADFTLDGGATWQTESTTSPSGGGGFAGGAFDEAGNLYVVGYMQDQVYITRRTPEGIWLEPVRVTPQFGHHQMAWVAAGGPGKVVVAWYGTLQEDADNPWYLFVAASLDADGPAPSWQLAIADPGPVVTQQLGRQLLDFMQVEIGPDGAVHVAYSKLDSTGGNTEERLHYVHSEPTLPLAAGSYFNGPRATK